jgi:hypothetical protein
MRTDGLYTSGSLNFSVTLPRGWMRSNTNEYLLVTRDGVLLQNILIKRIPFDEPLSHTKKKVLQGMLAQEAAEIILDDIRSDPALLDFELLDNAPATLDGIPGFRAVFTHKNMDGLKLKSVYYGFLTAEWVYAIRYTAALRHYFDEEFDTFEYVVDSFELLRPLLSEDD